GGSDREQGTGGRPQGGEPEGGRKEARGSEGGGPAGRRREAGSSEGGDAGRRRGGRRAQDVQAHADRAREERQDGQDGRRRGRPLEDGPGLQEVRSGAEELQGARRGERLQGRRSRRDHRASSALEAEALEGHQPRGASRPGVNGTKGPSLLVAEATSPVFIPSFQGSRAPQPANRRD